ncbi:MAG: HD domain-containing protein [Desulfobacteraceae bacterium]|nr:HD domain-containing protein [Desulfobacteraceae bacterium]
MVNSSRLSIDDLIKIVSNGGRVKTGIDVYNANGTLLLDRDFLVETTKTLEVIKENGVNSITVNSSESSGIWDKDGNQIGFDPSGSIDSDGSSDTVKEKKEQNLSFDPYAGEIERILYEIEEVKKVAEIKYAEAKGNVKKVLTDIRETGGKFDYNEVENNVADLVAFLTETDNAFSFLTKELFSYDDYLYNHSVNVCAIGTAILNRFNKQFSTFVNDFLRAGDQTALEQFPRENDQEVDCFKLFQKDDLGDISLGLFLHDIGKVMVSENVLNKKGKLTKEEFDEVKKHSYEYGLFILEENKLKNSYLKNIIQYHHGPLFEDEERCYPGGIKFHEIPIYVKICKLADIFDAMTSKRCYKEAFNQINVVTDLFRTYAQKDRLLQLILHSFVKSIGIYPPGSIVYLKNGQLAYVLHSEGPLLLPFTDTNQVTLKRKADPVDAGSQYTDEAIHVDANRSVKNPTDVYDLLPSYLKTIISKTAN